MRQGFGIGNDLLVVHYLADQSKQAFPLVGFIVSKKVTKKAVRRNRIKRQLRELIRRRLSEFPNGMMVVIRVKQSAQKKSYEELEQALDNALKRLKKKLQ